MARTNTLSNLTEILGFRPALTSDVYAASAVSTAWFAMNELESVYFLVTLGATTGAVTIAARRAADGSGTGAELITDKDSAFTATDDGKIAVVGISNREATSAKPYVGLLITPAAADTEMAAVAILNPAHNVPTTQPTASVAFVIEVNEVPA